MISPLCYYYNTNIPQYHKTTEEVGATLCSFCGISLGATWCFLATFHLTEERYILPKMWFLANNKNGARWIIPWPIYAIDSCTHKKSIPGISQNENEIAKSLVYGVPSFMKHFSTLEFAAEKVHSPDTHALSHLKSYGKIQPHSAVFALTGARPTLVLNHGSYLPRNIIYHGMVTAC